MPKRFDLIVFDWDGTLMDSTAVIASSIQLACRDLGLPVPTDMDAQHVIGLGLADALAYAVPSLTAAQLPHMVERYRHHYLARDQSLALFAGTRDMLDELRAAGFRLAVATGKNRAGLERALAHSGTAGLFDATRTADESRPKPDPQMLHDLVAVLGVDRARAIMVGDTTHDLAMARGAKVAALGVSYGAHPREQLVALEPLAVVETPAHLRRWLNQHA